jgi:hypothetical protein
MMVWMSMEMIWSMDVIWQDLGWEVAKLTAQAPTTNLTQHDSHWPDDDSKTIDYHHLDMSRDDGMDEHGSMDVIWQDLGFIGFICKPIVTP